MCIEQNSQPADRTSIEEASSKYIWFELIYVVLHVVLQLLLLLQVLQYSTKTCILTHRHLMRSTVVE